MFSLQNGRAFAYGARHELSLWGAELEETFTEATVGQRTILLVEEERVIRSHSLVGHSITTLISLFLFSLCLLCLVKKWTHCPRKLSSIEGRVWLEVKRLPLWLLVWRTLGPRVYSMCQLDRQSNWNTSEESWHGVQCWPKTTQPVFQELSTDLLHSEKGPGSLSRSNIQHYLCVSRTLFSPIFPPKSKSSENLLVTDLVTNIMCYYRDPAPVCLAVSLFLCLLLSPVFSFKLQCVLGLDSPRTSYFKIYINNVCTFFYKIAHTLLA